ETYRNVSDQSVKRMAWFATMIARKALVQDEWDAYATRCGWSCCSVSRLLAVRPSQYARRSPLAEQGTHALWPNLRRTRLLSMNRWQQQRNFKPMVSTSRGMSKVLSKEKRQQILALGRQGWA